MNPKNLIILIIVYLHCANTTAGVLKDSTQLHGFLSQAYTLTSANNFYGESQDNGSFDFYEIGINASIRPLSPLLFAGQVLSRVASSNDDSQAQIDFLLADLQIISSTNYSTGLRIGRIKNPFGFYNETRDVPFTRPSIILPQSIYFDRTRDLSLSSDGMQIYASKALSGSLLSLQLGVGNPLINSLKAEELLLGGDRPGAVQEQTSYIAKVAYESDGKGLNLAMSFVNLNMEYVPAAIDGNGAGKVNFQPRVFSAQYNALNWSTTVEYARRPFEFIDLSAYVPVKMLDGESYYIQGTYRLNFQWDAILRYDVTYQNRDDRYGEKFAASTGGLFPAHSQFAKDWTFGIQLSISKNWMLRAENHWVNGTAWLFREDNPKLQDTEQHWHRMPIVLP